MTVFKTTVKRIFKSKLNLIFMIIMPVAFIIFTMSANFEGRMVIGVVDEDRTELTETLIGNLAKKGEVILLTQDEIKPSIIDGSLDYIIHLEKGVTEGIIKNKNPQIKSYSIKESNASATISMYVNSYLNAAKNIALSTGGDSIKFYEGMSYYEKGSYRVDHKTIDVKADTRGKTSTALGFVIMGILYFSTFAPTMILKDKNNKTYYRIFTTPITVKSYMLQNILSFFVVSIIQVGGLLAIMKLVFKADLGPSIPSLFIMLLLFSVVSISLGVFISSISKDIRQASSISTLVSTPLLMLGGCYWPMDFMPDLLKNIAKFLPTTWGLKASQEIVYGTSLLNLGMEIGILVLFSVVFFLLGTWRRTDIAR